MNSKYVRKESRFGIVRPKLMYEFASQARTNGYDVIIAGAGGAAHLPGMVAS